MKKFLEYLGVPEGKISDAIKFWKFTIWVLALVVISILLTVIIIKIWNAYDLKPIFDGEPSDGVLFWLVVLSHILVISNTFNFTKDLNSTLGEFSNTNGTNNIEQDCNNLSWWFYGTIALSVLIIFSFILNAVNAIECKWTTLFLINEIVSALIFLSFIIIDKKFLDIITIAIGTNQNSFELKKNYFITEKALFFTDIAGFLGIFLIVIISLIMRISIVDSFHQGFSLGAIALHIIFSQVNFSLVKTMALKESF